MKTVLIVDDDPDVADALSMVLADEGYRVVTAQNGVEALRELKGGASPDVILLDLMMPVMDGYAFRAEQKMDAAFADIPVLVLTAGVVDERVADMAVAELLKKPIDLDSLIAAIERHS